MTSFFKKRTKIFKLIPCFVVLSLLVVGCAGPTFQGWSGFASSDNVLYFGGIDGKLYAISPVPGTQNLKFEVENEKWPFVIPSSGVPGSICGPACAPASPQATIYATPVVVGDIVCVATYTGSSAGGNGKLVAINRLAPGYSEGAPQRSKGEWIYPSGVQLMGAIVGSPVVVDKTIYVGSSDGKLYAVDTTYGENKWKNPFDTGGKIWTSPVVDGSLIYVSNYERKLFAVSSADGTQAWSTPLVLSANIASSPAVSADSIFVGTFDNHLHCIDKATGKEKWNFEGGNWFWSTPVVKDDVVYAGCLDHKVYALNTTTGKEFWPPFEVDDQVVATPVLVDNLLVLVSESGTVYVLNTDSGKPEYNPIPLDSSLKVPVKAPLYAEGNTVYVHGGNRKVYSVDTQSGKVAQLFSYSTNQ
jgi:outer membrane protein assembly factor BamB